MRDPHYSLMETSGAYRAWHSIPSHSAVHWMILLVFAGFSAVVILATLSYSADATFANTTPASPTDQNQVVPAEDGVDYNQLDYQPQAPNDMGIIDEANPASQAVN